MKVFKALLLTTFLLVFSAAQDEAAMQAPPMPSAAKALDPRWEMVAWSEEGNYSFIDKKTIAKNAGMIRFWVCEVFSESSAFYKSGLLRRVSRFEYDTVAGVMRAVGVTLYGADDKVVSTNMIESKWQNVVPGSALEMFAEKVK